MIYVECDPDFVLVKSITNISKREIIHEGGKGNVCKKLKKNQNSKGLVDEDPISSQPKYVEKMKVEENFSAHGIKVLYDNSNNNYLFVLCPRLEEWILRATKEAKIDIKKYGLPNDAEKLHKIINIRIDKFERLIEDLKEKSKMVKTLRKLIKGK
ncbi:MAG: hypothetical protein LWW95_04240 [Candidatus Desulfofervidus auxilii]|nr:hypothetical protein [Candidatus Desulfofervidus auxilii]